MNINVYEEYDVRINCEYHTLGEENETIYDNIFVEDKNTKTMKFNGNELLEEIQKRLNENYLSEFTIVGNELHFEYFNFNTGETSSIGFEIMNINGVSE